jgi:hypothetical protein
MFRRVFRDNSEQINEYEQDIISKKKEIDIQRKYIQKMKTAIPSRKIALLFKVEKEFRQELISRVKERRNK